MNDIELNEIRKMQAETEAFNSAMKAKQHELLKQLNSGYGDLIMESLEKKNEETSKWQKIKSKTKSLLRLISV